jgi:hypothetical protein
VPSHTCERTGSALRSPGTRCGRADDVSIQRVASKTSSVKARGWTVKSAMEAREIGRHARHPTWELIKRGFRGISDGKSLQRHACCCIEVADARDKGTGAKGELRGK